MSVERATHVGIGVTDLDRSVRFYRDVLGFVAVGELRIGGEPTETLLRLKDVDLEAVYLERDGLRLELLHFRSPGRPAERAADLPMNHPGFTHLSIRVSDLEALLASLTAQGVTVLEESRIDIPAFAAAAVFVTDPDGLKIELVQAPGDPGAPPGRS